MTAQPWPEADAAVLAPVAEHEDLRKVMRDLLRTHASHEEVRRCVDTPAGYSPQLWAMLNDEMNVSSLAVAEDRGGLGFGVGVLGVVLEEAGRALLPEPVLMSGVLGVRAVLAAPVGAVPDELVDGVLHGRLVVTVAWGAHAASAVTAVRTGSAWTVSCQVGRVLCGATADVVVVTAHAEAGDSLFLVDLRAGGVTRESLDGLDLTRKVTRLELASAPAYLLAGPDERQAVLDDLDTLATVGLAAEHVGMVDAMLEMTRAYLGQRHQFGRPLASFQVIKHRLADLLVDLERARSSARYAAAVFDQNPVAAALPAAIAGATCTDAVIRAAAETVQLNGGVGFTWEHPAHFYVRRALGDEAVFGSSRTHRARIAELLGI